MSDRNTLSRLAMLGLAIAGVMALGGGCQKTPVPVVPPAQPAPAPAPVAPVQNTLLPNDQQGAPIDEDFTAGSEYMRETPERYADLNGKKPFLMYFYADWCPECRLQHPELVKLFDSKKFGTPMMRVNYKDNQVTDEGVEWANTYTVTVQHTFIAYDASGKEVARHIGPIDETKLRELMAKANGK